MATTTDAEELSAVRFLTWLLATRAPGRRLLVSLDCAEDETQWSAMLNDAQEVAIQVALERLLSLPREMRRAILDSIPGCEALPRHTRRVEVDKARRSEARIAALAASDTFAGWTLFASNSRSKPMQAFLVIDRIMALPWSARRQLRMAVEAEFVMDLPDPTAPRT